MEPTACNSLILLVYFGSVFPAEINITLFANSEKVRFLSHFCAQETVYKFSTKFEGRRITIDPKSLALCFLQECFKRSQDCGSSRNLSKQGAAPPPPPPAPGYDATDDVINLQTFNFENFDCIKQLAFCKFE